MEAVSKVKCQLVDPVPPEDDRIRLAVYNIKKVCQKIIQILPQFPILFAPSEVSHLPRGSAGQGPRVPLWDAHRRVHMRPDEQEQDFPRALLALNPPLRD